MTLTTAKTFDAGSRFRCPRCGVAFAVRTPTVAGVRPLPHPADDAPRRSHAWLILLGLAGLGLLLLTGAGLALAVHFLPRREGPPVAAAPAPTPPASEADPLAQPPTPDVPVPISDKNDPPRQNPRPSDLPAAQPPELAPPEQSVLAPEEQEKVNKAIDRGLAWLKKTQLSDGSWRGSTASVWRPCRG